MANGTDKTADFASLKLTTDRERVAPGETFNLTVAPTLKPGEDMYRPEVIYKLFVRLSQGLKTRSVKLASNKINIASETAWTGAPGEYGDVDLSWEMGAGDRAKEAYKRWLLATWKSTNSAFDHLHPNALGWTIELLMDANHDNAPANLDATLYAMQDDDEKAPLAVPLSITIATAGPTFAAVNVLDSYQVNNHWVVSAGAGSIRVQATLAKPSSAQKIQVRWQVKGGGWNPAAEVALTSSTELAAFTVSHPFTEPVVLLFSCAEVGRDNWSQPAEIAIDVATTKLQLDNAVIRVDASSHIILTCTINEPSALVMLEKLEISVDNGAHWIALPESSLNKSTGSAPHRYPVSYDMTGTKAGDRDFSHGVLLRVTDKLQRPTPLQAQFDAESFLTAIWDSAAATPDDVDLGEQITYAIHLHCVQGVVLPAATIALLLPDAAVEAEFPALSWYWMMDEVSGEPKGLAHESDQWRGTSGDSKVYTGPLQSGLIHAVAHIRSNPLLLGHVLPGATLAISSDHFLHPFVSHEAARAEVFRPAPAFQLILFLGQHTNQYAVTLRGNFVPLLETTPQLVFTAAIDHDTPQTVPPAAIYLSPGYFELLLDHLAFPQFAKDGDHSVILTVRRTTDKRAAERSSHSETLVLTLKNSAASFEDTSVKVKDGALILDGKAIAPSAENPVKAVEMFWEGSGQGTAARPLALTVGENGRVSFHDSLALNQFTGALHPVVKAFTQDGNVETSLNLLFPTASGLLEMVLTINGSTVSDGGTSLVSPGAINFKISVTSLAGLPQKLNMFMTLGKAFSTKSGALFIIQPAAGKGTVHETEPVRSWNGISSSQLLQAKGLTQGATFSVQGATELKKEAGGAEAGILRIAFTEPDEPPYTFRAQDKDEGVIFTAWLQAQ